MLSYSRRSQIRKENARDVTTVEEGEGMEHWATAYNDPVTTYDPTTTATTFDIGKTAEVVNTAGATGD